MAGQLQTSYASEFTARRLRRAARGQWRRSTRSPASTSPAQTRRSGSPSSRAPRTTGSPPVRRHRCGQGHLDPPAHRSLPGGHRRRADKGRRRRCSGRPDVRRGRAGRGRWRSRVRARYATGAGGSQKGAFRKDADTATALLVKGAKYLTTQATIGGIAKSSSIPRRCDVIAGSSIVAATSDTRGPRARWRGSHAHALSNEEQRSESSSISTRHRPPFWSASCSRFAPRFTRCSTGLSRPAP
jgi:hypothetical protein